MENTINEFENILNQEDVILDSLTAKQAQMKAAVTEKNWENLTSIINEINEIYSSFSEKDAEREAVQDMIKSKELREFSGKITALRSKLLRCKIENQAITKYVNITREFIQGIVESAIPQSGSRVYSNKGTIVQPQPQSVVVNLSF